MIDTGTIGMMGTGKMPFTAAGVNGMMENLLTCGA